MTLLDDSFEVLKRGLSFSSMRHELISNNIANVSTAGYRRKDLDFHGMMQDNLSEDRLQMTQTNERHLPFNTENIDRALFVFQPNDTDVKSDNNNVDLDKEVVSMTDNSVYYNTLATLLNKKFKVLKDVISERIV